MDYKELLINSINRRYADINGIKEANIFLESKPLKKIKDNWIITLAIVAAFVGLMLINFNIKYFLICSALIAVFVVLFIFGNKYLVKCEKDCINIKQNFQNIHIPYNKVKNVYVAKTIRGIVVRSYVLVIRCEDNLSLLRDFEFPLLCAGIEDVAKFVNNFNIAEGKDEIAVKRDKRRSLKRIMENIFSFVCLIIIVWFCIVNGIIKIP